MKPFLNEEMLNGDLELSNYWDQFLSLMTSLFFMEKLLVYAIYDEFEWFRYLLPHISGESKRQHHSYLVRSTISVHSSLQFVIWDLAWTEN